MKKKFIAVYALIGVLALGSTTLTSCVDDNESPSVTAIRDAKAQSLQALANLTQAQADAEKIVSEAEARLTAAKAALKEAEAQLAQQKADSVKAVMDISIESAKQAAQAELYKQQGIVAEAQAQLIASLDAVDQATKQKIETLLANADALMNGGEYFTYQLVKDDPNTEEVESGWQWKSETINKSITDLQLEKVSIKAEQVKAEYGLANVKEAIAEKITKKDNEIAQYKAQIEAYTALKEASTREEVEAQYEQAKTDLVVQQNDLDSKEEFASLKEKDVDAVYKTEYIDTYQPENGNIKETRSYGTGTLSQTELYKAINASNYLYYTYSVKVYPDPVNQPDNWYYDIRDCVDNAGNKVKDPNYNPEISEKYNGGYNDPENGYYLSIYAAKYLGENDSYQQYEEIDDKLYEYQNADNTAGSHVLRYENQYLNYVNVKTDLLAEDKTEITNDIKVQEYLIEEGKKDLEEYKKTRETDIKNADDALKAAKEAWEKENTHNNQEAVKKAQAVRDQIDTDIANEERILVTSREENIEDMEKALEVLANIETLLTGDALKTYQAEYKKYMAAQEAQAEAEVEVLKATHTYTVTNTLVQTLKPYVDNDIANDLLVDWDAKIKECNDNIEKAEIAKATATGKYDILESAEGDPKSKEKVTEEVMNWYIEKLAQDLAAVEAQLNYYNSLYKSCMDQANELIQNGAALPDTPATDTPAEGEGEETPAE